MVTVVGKNQEAIKRVTCYGCASILEYTASEIFTYKSYDYGGGCDVHKAIKCPECGKDVTL